MRIHIFGDSHVRALYDGVDPLREQLAQASIEVDFYSRSGPSWETVHIRKIGTSFRYRGACKWERPLDYTVDQPGDIYVFSSPLHSTALWRTATWREFCPWRCAVEFPSLHPVSDAIIEGIAEALMKTPLGILKEMKECDYMVLVAESPRPLSKGPAVKGIDPRVVVGVDNVFRSYITRRLGEIGVPIIRIPDFTHQDGLTLDQYSDHREDDAHHGNAEFGTVMMKQIVRITTGIALN